MDSTFVIYIDANEKLSEDCSFVKALKKIDIHMY